MKWQNSAAVKHIKVQIIWLRGFCGIECSDKRIFSTGAESESPVAAWGLNCLAKRQIFGL